MAVAITRRDLSADELRREAARSRDANAARRMRALALALEGCSRETAAATCGMDRQTLRDWVHRYNAEGLAGLSNRRAPGPAPRLSAEQEAELAGAAKRSSEPGIGRVGSTGGLCVRYEPPQPLLQHAVADATPRRATVGIDLRKTGPGPGHFGEKIITRQTRNALPLSGFLVLHGRLTRPRPPA